MWTHLSSVSCIGTPLWEMTQSISDLFYTLIDNGIHSLFSTLNHSFTTLFTLSLTGSNRRSSKNFQARTSSPPHPASGSPLPREGVIGSMRISISRGCPLAERCSTMIPSAMSLESDGFPSRS